MKWVIALIIGLFWVLPSFADYEAAARYSASFRGISMLVIVDGEVVFEDYPNDGAADRPHSLASGTKSFAGILAAAAVQDGLLDLDERVSDTITEWQETRREDITVRQLLNLTDGLARRGGPARPPAYAVAIQVRLAREPGTVFNYHALPFQVFGELMRRKLDGSLLDYLNRRIFEPIGLEYANWRRDRDGNPLLSAGAQLTARNWARLGELVLARGEWSGEALVSPAAFAELFQGSDVNPGYGLAWWLNRSVDPDYARATPPLNSAIDFWKHPDVFPDDMVFAAGVGDQRLYLSWERNMIVVRQAEGIMGALLGHTLSWSDVEFWRLLEAPSGERPAPLPTVPQTAAPAEAETLEEPAETADPHPAGALELTPEMMSMPSPALMPEPDVE